MNDPQSTNLPPELEAYLELYDQHRAAGDDPMNARLRLVEAGATEEESLLIQDSFMEED